MVAKKDDIELESQELESELAVAATGEAETSSVDEHELNEEEVKRYVEDDEDDLGEISWRSIMGGDLFQSRFMMRQVVFIMFVAVLMLIYTGNRYDSQQDIIEIDSLKVQLQNERYNVLTQSSELLNMSRQSFIEKALKANGDSALLNPTTPPYEIVLER